MTIDMTIVTVTTCSLLTYLLTYASSFNNITHFFLHQTLQPFYFVLCTNTIIIYFAKQNSSCKYQLTARRTVRLSSSANDVTKIRQETHQTIDEIANVNFLYDDNVHAVKIQ